jgi:hypothetical protein
MSAFDDRGRAHEAKFARDQEVEFRITARRNRLLGEWAAERMGLTPEETDAYAKAVVQADFEEAGDEDVTRKLAGDLTAANVEIGDAEIRAILNEKTAEARRHFIDSQN